MSTTQSNTPPSQKMKLPYSRLRPLAPQPPYRHLRTSSSPASTAYSTKTVQSSYPSSGSSTSLASSTSLNSTGSGTSSGSSTSSQPFSTPPSHLPLPHISLPNLQFGIPTPAATQDENKNFEPAHHSTPSNPEPQPHQLQRTQHIRIPSTTQTTYRTKNPNPKPPKRYFSTAVSILLSLHVLLVSVLVMSWLGHSASGYLSMFGGEDGGYMNDANGGFADLREWIDASELGDLFEPRERVGVVIEDGDVEEEEVVVDEEEEGIEETQLTLDIVLEELKGGHVIARKLE